MKSFLTPTKLIYFDILALAFFSCISVGHSLAFTHPSQIYSLSKANVEATAEKKGRSARDGMNRKKHKNKHSCSKGTLDEVCTALHPSASTSTALQQTVISENENSERDSVIEAKDESDNDVMSKVEAPLDTRYTTENINRQREQYQAMTSLGGDDMINDVYVRNPTSHTFWYCGKISCCSGTATLEQCVQRQWNLIEEHAARLRNLELGPHFGCLEIWTAPGNSEMDVAYNRPNIIFQKHRRLMTQDEVTDNKQIVRRSEVGFIGEVYEGGEEGFRTKRNEDGTPRNPEITGPP